MTISRLDASVKIAGNVTRRFAREQADKLLGRLAFQIGRAIKSRKPDTIHDLRVSIRRFEQALRIFKPCFRGKEVRKIRRELKQIMYLAGQVRNHDLATKVLTNRKRFEGTALQQKIQIRRREVERSLVTLLKSWLDRKSSLKWRAALERAAAATRDDFSKAPIVQTARQTLPGMLEDFFERGDAAAGAKASPRDLHRFRLASKKFRYTLELFTPVYGLSLNPRLDGLRRIQTLLGDINDFETLRNLLRPYEGAEALMGWLKKRQRKRFTEFAEYWSTNFAASEDRQSWIESLKVLAAGPSSTKKPAARSVPESRSLGRGAVA